MFSLQDYSGADSMPWIIKGVAMVASTGALLLLHKVRQYHSFQEMLTFPQTAASDVSATFFPIREVKKAQSEKKDVFRGLIPLTRGQMTMQPTEEFIQPAARYRLRFARKPGFQELAESLGLHDSGLLHSAICIENVADGSMLVLGRQCPWLGNEAKQQEARAKAEYPPYTKMDNEAYYIMFYEKEQHDKAIAFYLEETSVTFTGKELNQIIKDCQKNVCEPIGQTFTMLFSNCYTASVYMLAQAMFIIERRTTESHSAKQEKILDIYKQYYYACKDDGSQGICNNNLMLDLHQKVGELADKFHLLKFVLSFESDTEERITQEPKKRRPK